MMNLYSLINAYIDMLSDNTTGSWYVGRLQYQHNNVCSFTSGSVELQGESALGMEEICGLPFFCFSNVAASFYHTAHFCRILRKPLHKELMKSVLGTREIVIFWHFTLISASYISLF